MEVGVGRVSQEVGGLTETTTVGTPGFGHQRTGESGGGDKGYGTTP